MSHWITSHPEFGIDQSASSSTKQQSDETFEDIKAIAELEPSGIVHIAVLFPFQNCKFYVIRRHSLTRMSASCTKTPIHRKISKSIQIHFPIQIANCFFPLSVCFAKNVQCSFLIYTFDIKLLIHKCLHTKREIDYR